MNKPDNVTPAWFMRLKKIRDRYFPMLRKYYILKAPNFLLTRIKGFEKISHLLVQNMLRKSKIKYIDLGGYSLAEGYLTISISPIQLYGVPSIKTESVAVSYDENKNEIAQSARKLFSPAISLYYDIEHKLPLDSESLLGINMSHVLEHFSPEAGLNILKECHRILSKEGVLRISCPDLARYAKAYVNRDADFFEKPIIRAFCHCKHLSTYGGRFISKAYDNDYVHGHKWFYDAESVLQLLKTAGFSKIEERSVHESSLPNIEVIEPSYRAPESFYVEAVK